MQCGTGDLTAVELLWCHVIYYESPPSFHHPAVSFIVRVNAFDDIL